ncbi:MAG TPA: hypothetical protein VH186_03520 [Chloroflexia bacterium]|nr:hypothetical protein [Chloroflexia bacterium]
MNKIKKNGPCYYCGGVSVSIEHAPPQQMFKDFSFTPITVPACKLHNTDKSFYDEIIVKAFLKSISLTTPTPKYPSHPDLHKAIGIALPEFKRVKNKVEERPLTKDLAELADKPVVHIKPGVNVGAWITQITAALVYRAVGNFEPSINWEQVMCRGLNFIETGEALSQQELVNWFEQKETYKVFLGKLNWKPGWYEPPYGYPVMLYRFDFAYTYKSKNLLIQHTFYNSYVFVVQIKINSQIKEAIKNHIRSLRPLKLRPSNDTAN